jgi:hypothetical protein
MSRFLTPIFQNTGILKQEYLTLLSTFKEVLHNCFGGAERGK